MGHPRRNDWYGRFQSDWSSFYRRAFPGGKLTGERRFGGRAMPHHENELSGMRYSVMDGTSGLAARGGRGRDQRCGSYPGGWRCDQLTGVGAPRPNEVAG
jgi:hypothetical protein